MCYLYILLKPAMLNPFQPFRNLNINLYIISSVKGCPLVIDDLSLNAKLGQRIHEPSSSGGFILSLSTFDACLLSIFKTLVSFQPTSISVLESSVSSSKKFFKLFSFSVLIDGISYIIRPN